MPPELAPGGERRLRGWGVRAAAILCLGLLAAVVACGNSTVKRTPAGDVSGRARQIALSPAELARASVIRIADLPGGATPLQEPAPAVLSACGLRRVFAKVAVGSAYMPIALVREATVRAVVGVFDSHATADRVFERLHRRGMLSCYRRVLRMLVARHGTPGSSATVIRNIVGTPVKSRAYRITTLASQGAFSRAVVADIAIVQIDRRIGMLTVSAIDVLPAELLDAVAEALVRRSRHAASGGTRRRSAAR